MQSADVTRVEEHLRVRLPAAYREALLNVQLPGDTEDHPEFTTDAEVLLSDNEHFLFDPEDISKERGSGVLGAVRFLLLYGSGKRLLERRRKWHESWVEGQRFVIGCDLGEERYFIDLREVNPQVSSYDLESKRSKVVAQSIPDWIEIVGRIATEAENET